MALRNGSFKQPQPDTDLEGVHEQVFGLRPEDLRVPLSEQGLLVKPNPINPQLESGAPAPVIESRIETPKTVTVEGPSGQGRS